MSETPHTFPQVLSFLKQELNTEIADLDNVEVLHYTDVNERKEIISLLERLIALTEKRISGGR